MDESWAYLGLSAEGEDVAVVAARPRWNLAVGGRKPRGEWCPALELIERVPRTEIGPWLHRRVADPRGPVWESRRLTALVDVGRYGAGDLLRSTLDRAFDRWIVLRRNLRLALADVTDRDVLRSQRPDGVLSLPRREVLTGLLAAVEADLLEVGRGRLTGEFLTQLEEVKRRPEPGQGPAREDLARAAGLTVWAVNAEGGGRLRGMAAGEGRIAVY